MKYKTPVIQESVFTGDSKVILGDQLAWLVGWLVKTMMIVGAVQIHHLSVRKYCENIQYKRNNLNAINVQSNTNFQRWINLI